MNRIVAVIATVCGLWVLLASPRSPGEMLVKFGLVAVLLVFAYRRFNAPPGKTAEYAKRQDGALLRFDVKPATLPISLFMAAFAVACAWAIVGSAVTYLWVMGLLFVAGAALLLLSDPRGGQAGRPRSFGVGPQGIEVDGRVLRKDDIHQLRIKNKLAGDVEIVYDTSQGVSTGTLVGLAHRRRLAQVAYRIEVESGGKAHVLAAGLDEVTARGLVAEVGKALNPGA